MTMYPLSGVGWRFFRSPVRAEKYYPTLTTYPILQFLKGVGTSVLTPLSTQKKLSKTASSVKLLRVKKGGAAAAAVGGSLVLP